MPDVVRFRWLRVLAAIFAAEAVPILVLVLVVVIYGFLKAADWSTPEEFAPRAGNWVGPIAGFLATMAFAYWAARNSDAPMRHGVAVGVGTAALDLGLGVALSGGQLNSIFVISNLGRIAAGVIGGKLAGK